MLDLSAALPCHCCNQQLTRSCEVCKAEKLNEHLDLAQKERIVYQDMVEQSKSLYKNQSLRPHAPCSSMGPCHYSFDFAEQVHLPHGPLQPAPMYFLCPRKVGIFGVCSEDVAKQINFLNDEVHCTSKGSIAVISYLDFFFKHYGFGVLAEQK